MVVESFAWQGGLWTINHMLLLAIRVVCAGSAWLLVIN